MARRVLTDASPLIGLAIVGGLPWLKVLFGKIWMPQEVVREILSGQVTRGEQEIRQAITAGWLKVCDPAPLGPDLPDLDEGESACIRIALAYRGKSLILMDERAGRAVATERGVASRWYSRSDRHGESARAGIVSKICIWNIAQVRFQNFG